MSSAWVHFAGSRAGSPGAVMAVGALRSSPIWGSGAGGTPDMAAQECGAMVSGLGISVGHEDRPGLTMWNKCSLDISWCDLWSFGAQLGAGRWLPALPPFCLEELCSVVAEGWRKRSSKATASQR